MSMEYIRKSYHVPAKRGMRVVFAGNIGPTPLHGTIIGSRNALLCVLVDGEIHRRLLHPTWELTYTTSLAGKETP